jgi:hypothetical protein
MEQRIDNFLTIDLLYVRSDSRFQNLVHRIGLPE